MAIDYRVMALYRSNLSTLSPQSRKDVPKLVERCLAGEIPIDHYITHVYDGVKMMNDAIVALHSGECLRAVVRY